MTSPSQAVPFQGEAQLVLQRAEVPSPELNRFFYQAVGSRWNWYARLRWTRAEWLAYVDRAVLETWVGYRQGTPAGYFELEAQPKQDVELVHFGLLPQFVGTGLGSELLSAAIGRAWELGAQRVWLHTCSLDHPNALPTYQSRGFRIYDRQEAIEALADEDIGLWPEASMSRSGRREP